MKKIHFFLIILITPSILYAQKQFEYGSFPYETWVKTLKFNVLDINTEKKVLAFKHIYELQANYTYDETGEIIERPVDCQYAGMESMPYAGVVLGIFDLESGQYIKTFTVYESCYNIEECYSHELSKLKLDSVKQLFAEYGLDHTKKIKPMVFSNINDETINELELNGILLESTFVNDYDNMQTRGYLHADGELLYESHYFDNFAMASNGEVYHKAAYKKGPHVVFLIKFFHNNNMEGPSSYEFHHFTPLYLLKSNTLTKVH